MMGSMIDDCACCGYCTQVSRFPGNGGGEDLWLCEICSSTRLSMSVRYPGQCVDIHLNRSVGWIANKILDEIRHTR